MFQDKNIKDEQTDFDSSLSSVLAPIHLMKNDLEEIKNPKKNKPEQNFKTTPAFNNFSEKQKASPFFNAANIQKSVENKPLEAPTPPPPPPIKETPVEIKKEGPREFGSSTFIPQPKEMAKEAPKEIKESSLLNNILTAVAALLLLFLFGTGGYYFWMTKNSSSQAQPENNQPATVETEVESQPTAQPVVAEPEPAKSIDFSTEKPNYLSLDMANADKAFINNQIDLYLEKAKELKITAPAEFIITDASNNPVAFKTFAEKIGIVLPAQIIASLKDTFSLFIYNDNENYRLALSVNSLNDLKLKAELLKEESKLTTDLAPLLKNPENRVLAESPYQTGLYKNTISVRYANIVSPEYLSIDYAIVNKTLVIGTTKNATFAVIDYISAPKKTVAKTKENSNSLPKTVENNTSPIDPVSGSTN